MIWRLVFRSIMCDKFMIWWYEDQSVLDHFRPLLPENGLQEIILTIAVTINCVTAFSFPSNSFQFLSIGCFVHRYSGSVDFKQRSSQRYLTQVEQSNLGNFILSTKQSVLLLAHCTPHCHLARQTVCPSWHPHCPLLESFTRNTMGKTTTRKRLENIWRSYK